MRPEARLLPAAGEHVTTVSARKLQDILRSLPEGTAIALELQDKRLQIKAGKSKFSLQTLPAQDFPKLAPAGAASATLEVAHNAISSSFLAWFNTRWRSRTSATI